MVTDDIYIFSFQFFSHSKPMVCEKKEKKRWANFQTFASRTISTVHCCNLRAWNIFADYGVMIHDKVRNDFFFISDVRCVRMRCDGWIKIIWTYCHFIHLLWNCSLQKLIYQFSPKPIRFLFYSMVVIVLSFYHIPIPYCLLHFSILRFFR